MELIKISIKFIFAKNGSRNFVIFAKIILGGNTSKVRKFQVSFNVFPNFDYKMLNPLSYTSK